MFTKTNIDRIIHTRDRVKVVAVTGEVAHEFSVAEYRVLERLNDTIPEDRPVSIDRLAEEWLGRTYPHADQGGVRRLIAKLIERGYIAEPAPNLIDLRDDPASGTFFF